MKISIVIPIYNVEKYIINCLISVVNQKKTIHTLECILIDDCGNDNSIKLASDFIKNYEKDIEFKLIKHKYNRGLSAARNTGLSACTGDYVLFLDSDDTLVKDCIYNLSLPIDTHLYDFVLGEVRTIGEMNKKPSLNLAEGEYIGNRIVRETYLDHKWYMMAWNKLCNIDFLRSHNLTFEEGLIHEDDLWSFSLSLQAESFYVVRKQTYNYLIREASIITSTKQIVHIDAYLSIVNKITYYIKSYNLDISYILFCHQYLLGTYVYLRYLGFIEGYRYFKKIINNELYEYYYKTLLLEESSKYSFKIRLAHYPLFVGYLIFRVFFFITFIKQRLHFNK